MVKRPKKLTQAEIDRIVALYRAGKNGAEIAKEIGRHPCTVNDKINELGLRRDEIQCYDTQEQIDRCQNCTMSREYCDHHCSWKRGGPKHGKTR